jgi:hypothetical protein
MAEEESFQAQTPQEAEKDPLATTAIAHLESVL